MPRRIIDEESVATIDGGAVTILRHGDHIYTLRLRVGFLHADLLLTTDNLANVADALLVVSEADRAERAKARREVSSMT